MQQTHKQKQNKYCKTVRANCCMTYQLWQATAWPPFPWTYAEMQIWFGPTIVLCGSIDLSSHSVSRNRATKNFGFRPEHHRRLTHTDTNHTYTKKQHIPHTEPTCHSHIWPSLVSIVPNNKNTSRNIELMAYWTWIGDQGIVKTGKLRVHLSSRCGLQRTTSPNFQVLAPPSSKGQLSLNCQRGQKNN